MSYSKTIRIKKRGIVYGDNDVNIIAIYKVGFCEIKRDYLKNIQDKL